MAVPPRGVVFWLRPNGGNRRIGRNCNKWVGDPVMKRLIIISILLALAACGGNEMRLNRIPAGPPTVASNWEVGPIINGKSRSIGTAIHPAPHPDGLAIDIPHPTALQGHVHYVTFNPGPLVGRTRLTLRYRIEMEEETRIVPSSPPGWTGPALITLFLQRCGDNWTANREYETYRWWATGFTVMDLRPGDNEISVPLNAGWTATISSSIESNPAEFQAALVDTCRVGFTLGGGDGYGHGVYATGPARLIIREFIIE